MMLAATVPPPPPLLVITKGCPRNFSALAASALVDISTTPPGAKLTIMLTGFAGKADWLQREPADRANDTHTNPITTPTVLHLIKTSRVLVLHLIITSRVLKNNPCMPVLTSGRSQRWSSLRALPSYIFVRVGSDIFILSIALIVSEWRRPRFPHHRAYRCRRGGDPRRRRQTRTPSSSCCSHQERYQRRTSSDNPPDVLSAPGNALRRRRCKPLL